MNLDLIITVVTLAVAIGLLLSDRLRADLVALLMVVVLGLTGVLTAQEAFSGFSRAAVITIMAIFILSDGLRRTGVTEQVGGLLLRAAGSGERRQIVVVMVAGAFLSLFMNNIAAASVLLPAVSGAARKAGVNPSRLLMPLAFGTLLGGMATLFTTTNIVVSGLMRDQGLRAFGVLDFAPVGLPLVVVGILYVVLWGRHRLPAQSPMERFQALAQEKEGGLVGIYKLGEDLFRARVPARSSLIDRPLAESNLREQFGISVVAVERDGHEILSPPPETILHQGDVMVCGGDVEEFRRRDVEPYLEIMPPRGWRDEDLVSPEVVVAEAVLAPRSRLIGQTLRSAHFRRKYGMTALAIWRAGRPIGKHVTQQTLQFGDALLLQGPRGGLTALRDEPDLIILGDGEPEAALVPEKNRLALAIMAVAVLVAAIAPGSVGEVMLGGALLMILAGVLTMDNAYQAIEWKSVFLVAGMLPVGTAMTKTGAAALLGTGFVSLVGPLGPYALLLGLILLSMLLTQAMNGAAVAAVMAPVAIQAGSQIGADPRAMALGVAIATSMAFLSPLGHAVNVLVMGPGGYRFRDYYRIGLPMTVLLIAVLMVVLPLLWPLQP
ncbi:MAG TPA: SLC13 family permease [Ardenticatenaceae bacterium]